jgi:hypothetical protein
MNRARYFAALWACTAIAVAALYTLQHAIGGHMPERRLSTLFLFGEWMLFTPLVAWLARRFRRSPVHVPLALAFAFLALVLHKLALCPAGDYANCVAAYELQPWLFAWLLSGSFVYAGTTAGIWLLDSADAAQESAIAAARMEEELSAAGLRLAQRHLRPETIAAEFDAISKRLATDPRAAEMMITALADSLRERTRAFEDGS